MELIPAACCAIPRASGVTRTPASPNLQGSAFQNAVGGLAALVSPGGWLEMQPDLLNENLHLNEILGPRRFASTARMFP